MTTRAEFLIGAVHSGSGKTLLTLGILAALKRRGLAVQPFKCGPDFIDPTLHQLAAGHQSINLDRNMMGAAGCDMSYLRHSRSAGAVVVEGVMGLFDGGEASSASLARQLDLPVVLVVDVRSAAESVAAVIKGFEVFDPKVRIAGVICNRVGSPRHRELIEDAVKRHCTTPVLGYFPREKEFDLPARHLGLYMGHELGEEGIDLVLLAETVEKAIDIDRLLALTNRRVEQVEQDKPHISRSARQKTCRLAVARDEAFCFYYPDNLTLLEELGFELIEFSPLRDQRLPDDIRGIYLGGGYPELHAAALSANTSLRQAIAGFAAAGGMVYGECGGFMYMTRELVDDTGRVHPMTGIFDVVVRMNNRLRRLGYRQPQLLADCPLGPAGQGFFGHEFHYSDIIERAAGIEYLYRTEQEKMEGCLVKNAMGSYIHLHFAQSFDCLHRLFMLLTTTGE